MVETAFFLGAAFIAQNVLLGSQSANPRSSEVAYGPWGAAAKCFSTPKSSG
jgi:hypothetical protein